MAAPPAVDASSPRADRRAAARWLPHAALVALGLAIYAQVGGHSFVIWDDPAYVTNNAFVRRGLAGDAPLRALTGFWSDNWHPLTWWSHMLDVQLFGMWAGGHHLVNVFWHLLNGALVFELLRRWTGAAGRSALIAALFVAHPLHVESVAWVAERKDVLAAFFWLLTVLLYGRWVARPGPGRYLAVTLSFVLGLMSKPMLVSLPLILLILDIWPHRRLDLGAAPAAAWRSLRPRVVEKLPWFLLAFVVGLLTLRAQSTGLDAGGQFALGERLAIAVTALASYLGQTLWPQDLMFYYPVAPRPAWMVGLATLVVCVISAGAWWQRHSRPWVLAGWLWFVVALLPVLGLVKVGTHAHADRYTYLPHIGLFWVMVGGAIEFAERRRWPAAVPKAAGVIIVLVMGLLAHRQVAYWKDGETLFGRALALQPAHHVAHLQLAEEYLARGRVAEAERHAQRALELHPAPRVVAHANALLGNIALARRLPQQALEHYRQAYAVDDRSPLACYNLGIGLAEVGDLPAAAAMFERALMLSPEASHAANNLGVVRSRMGDLNGAAAAHAQALRSDPGNLGAAVNLANVRAAQGQRQAAEALLAAVLQADPNHPAALRARQRLAIGHTDGGRQ